MQIRDLYTPENVERSRYAQIGAGILSAALCGYLILSTLLSIRGIYRTDRLLCKVKTNSGKLSREASKLQQTSVAEQQPSSGGMGSFVLELSKWAKSRGVSIQTLTPIGNPAPTAIKVGKTKLGTWNAHDVRVDGQGDFLQVRSLMNEFRDPDAPVQLESIALSSAGTGSNGIVTFSLRLKIYEKDETGQRGC